VTSAPLLDTHAWIWWVHGDRRLGTQTLNKLDQLPASSRPAISDISLWEVATLVSLGRLEIESTLDAWLAMAAHPSTVRILPITPRIAVEVARLPDTFQRDPADRVIVSTSRVHGLPILTRDAAIAKSGLARLWSPGATREAFRDALPRIYELKDIVRDPSHPDAYFQDFEENLKQSTHVLDTYAKVERHLTALNETSWDVLKHKVAHHLMSREPGRGWRQVFDLLNEAKAHSYLQGIGCSEIHFIEESPKQRTPDLSARRNDAPLLCEVKTINVSDEEADRRKHMAGSRHSSELNETFLKKIRSTLESATAQIDSYDSQRLARHVIFIVVHFDGDHVGDFAQEYFRRIDSYLETHAIAGADIVFCPARYYFERNITMRSAAVFLE
jgi:PIN domain nuclease of toxin-antitoxin system